MQRLVKIVACGLVLVAAATGCGGHGVGRSATATGCAAFAVDAVRRHVSVGGLPGPCRGLGPAELGQAVRIAVTQLARHGDKARRRHLAILAIAHLEYLIGAARRASSARWAADRRGGSSTGAASTGSGPASPRRRIPAGAAALVAWLLTAGSGGVLLAKRLARGGTRGGPRSGSARPAASPAARPADSPPIVALSHFGLAIGALAVWVGYLLSGWVPVAWIAAGILLPVAGLGIATLMLTIPDPGSARQGPVSNELVPHGPGRQGKVPVVVIAAHGVLATVTILLALLAAVAAVTRR